MTAHQAPSSLGSSRQEHWTGLPFPSLRHEVKSESQAAQSCPIRSKLRDCSLPGSSFHGSFQARLLEWVAIAFSRRSSWPRDWAWVSRIVGRRFTVWVWLHWKLANPFWKTEIFLWSWIHSYLMTAFLLLSIHRNVQTCSPTRHLLACWLQHYV